MPFCFTPNFYTDASLVTLQCSATRPRMLAITDLMILLWRRPYLDAKIQNGILSGFLRIERVHI